MKKVLCLCVVALCGCSTYKQTVVLSVQTNDPALVPMHQPHQPHTTICVFPATAKIEARWEK